MVNYAGYHQTYDGPKLRGGLGTDGQSQVGRVAFGMMFNEKSYYEKLNEKLMRRGFSEQDLYGLYADLEKQGVKKLLGSAATQRADEFERRLLAYVDEQNALYSRVKEQEQEMLQEDKINRAQEEYDKEVAETSRISIQESGQRAEKARQAQKSQEYLDAQRASSGRSAGRIAVRRPM
jgi:hypothetical protein